MALLWDAFSTSNVKLQLATHFFERVAKSQEKKGFMIRACQKFPAACPTTFSFQIIFGTSTTNQTKPGTTQVRELEIIWILEVQGPLRASTSSWRPNEPLDFVNHALWVLDHQKSKSFQEISKSGSQKWCYMLWRNPVENVWEIQLEEKSSEFFETEEKLEEELRILVVGWT